MGKTNLRHSLEKKYSALCGQLDEVKANIARIQREQERLPTLQARVTELQALIDSATLLLRDADDEWEPAQTPSVKPWTHALPVPFGSCGRRGMEVLRKATAPMTARQVAEAVLREAGCEEVSAEELRRTVSAIESSLRKHRGSTVQSSGKYPAQWRSVINPGLKFDV